MAYCTTDHVAGEFKGIVFNSTSTVTESEVIRFIAEAGAEINSTLSSRYSVPITGTESLILIRQINIMLVAQRVKDILTVKTGVTAPDQGNNQGNTIRLDITARKMLQNIISEKINLTDATLLDSQSGVASYNVTNSIEPFFEKGVDQW